MREVTFEELVEKTHKSLRAPLPKGVVRFICRHALRRMYKIMQMKLRRLFLAKCDINGVYQDYDWEALCNEFMDVDETKELTQYQRRMLGTTKKFTKRDAKKISHTPMRY